MRMRGKGFQRLVANGCYVQGGLHPLKFHSGPDLAKSHAVGYSGYRQQMVESIQIPCG
jgi:hypothetical protein